MRQRLIAAREALSPEEREALTRALVINIEKLLARYEPSTLGFCWPFRSEPDLTGLVARWLADRPNRRAALPIVTDGNHVLRFRSWKPGDVLLTDRHGILAPQTGDWVLPDLLLIPVNGFDERGYRLGYGAGYFDRTLPQLEPLPVTVGIGFELARLPLLAEAEHDIPLDWIVTENGAFASWTTNKPPSPD